VGRVGTGRNTILTYQAQFKVKAIIGVPLKASSMEEAWEEAKVVTKNKFSVQLAGMEIIDGGEELIGVQGDWDLE